MEGMCVSSLWQQAKLPHHRAGSPRLHLDTELTARIRGNSSAPVNTVQMLRQSEMIQTPGTRGTGLQNPQTLPRLLEGLPTLGVRLPCHNASQAGNASFALLSACYLRPLVPSLCWSKIPVSSRLNYSNTLGWQIRSLSTVQGKSLFINF